MSMKINERIKVRYIGDDNPLALRKDKIYTARILEKSWYGIVDETKEEYAYPPELFEIVKDGFGHERKRGQAPCLLKR